MSDIDKHRGKKLKRIPGKEQTGYIKVMSKIVKDLSSGIYSSPANCIKELVNNSFDADATKVIIRAKPALDILSVTDNGNGISIEEFDERFSVISKSYKRIGTDVTEKFKRPIIGKIGIGFIAVSEICDKLVVISKKKGDIGRIKAEIDFSKFKSTEIDEIDEFYKKSDYKIVYEENKDKKDDQYTKVILTELTQDFKEILLDKDTSLKKDDTKRRRRLIGNELEDKTYEEIIEYLIKRNISTYQQLGAYWKLILDIAKTVPVEYLENGPVKLLKNNSIVESIKNLLKSYNFKVDFDGLDIKKPILFPNDEDKSNYESDYIIHTFDEKIEIKDTKLSFKGYIYSQHGGINPKEDQGILIRVKNVKIGDVDSSYLDYPFVSNQLFRHWNFGEIYITEGLEDAMNIDRNSFRLSHSHYRRLKKFLHDYLDTVVFPHCNKGFWKAKSDKRKQEQAKKRQRRIKSAVKPDFKQKDVTIIEATDRSGDAIEIKPEESIVIIRPNTDVFNKFSKKEKELLEEVLVIFESVFRKISQEKGNLKELKEYFYDKLKKRES